MATTLAAFIATAPDEMTSRAFAVMAPVAVMPPPAFSVMFPAVVTLPGTVIFPLALSLIGALASKRELASR